MPAQNYFSVDHENRTRKMENVIILSQNSSYNSWMSTTCQAWQVVVICGHCNIVISLNFVQPWQFPRHSFQALLASSSLNALLRLLVTGS